MSDIKKLLESIDSMSAAENKPTGPKFPGYWRGTDSASKAKSKMVGSAQENIMAELHTYTKENAVERKIKKTYESFINEETANKLDEPIPITRTSYIEPDIEKPKATIAPPPDTFTKSDQVKQLVDLLYGDPNDPESVQALAAVRKKFGIQPSADTGGQPEGFGKGRPPGAISVPYATDNEITQLSPRQQAIQDIATLNKIADPNKIRIGQVLTLPDGSTYTVAKGDNLWNISKGKFRGTAPKRLTTNENYLNKFRLFLEYGNAQDPNAQTTSPVKASSPEEQAQKQKAAQDQRVDATTAKNLAGSIKPVLPPNIDANTLASAIVKINDNKPLTQPEQMAMGPMNALVTKAAETSQTSNELGNILRTVAQLAKKGKA